jgi:hypothetical protein
MSRTPLEDVTYQTVETVTLTVSQMLALTSALFDAANWNEEHGWLQCAESIRKLRKEVIEPQTEDLINEADRKCSENLDALRDRRRQKLAEDRAVRKEMEDDEFIMDEGDNRCDDGQGPRQEYSTGKAELET